jgi:hypothetical protein
MREYSFQILVIIIFSSCSEPVQKTEPLTPPTKTQVTIFRTDSVMVEMGKRHTLLFNALKGENWKESSEQLSKIQDGAEAIANHTSWKQQVHEFAEQSQYLQQVIDGKKKNETLKAFGLLTEGCNRCHAAANAGFAMVKVPEERPAH